MKRNILIFLIIILLLTGCKNKTNDNKIDEKPVVKINNTEIELNNDNSFNNMVYKVNSLFKSNSDKKNRVITYDEKNKKIFEIKMTYSNKTLQETKESLSYETFNKRIGSKKFLYAETQSTDKKSKIHEYYYEYKKKTYNISFISNEDIEKFENAFMSTVDFK